MLMEKYIEMPRLNAVWNHPLYQKYYRENEKMEHDREFCCHQIDLSAFCILQYRRYRLPHLLFCHTQIQEIHRLEAVLFPGQLHMIRRFIPACHDLLIVFLFQQSPVLADHHICKLSVAFDPLHGTPDMCLCPFDLLLRGFLHLAE